jgi:hypothetical protein
MDADCTRAGRAVAVRVQRQAAIRLADFTNPPSSPSDELDPGCLTRLNVTAL